MSRREQQRAVLIGLVAFGLSSSACSFLLDADRMRQSTEPSFGDGAPSNDAKDAADAATESAASDDWNAWPEVFRDPFNGTTGKGWRSEWIGGGEAGALEVAGGVLKVNTPAASPNWLELELGDSKWQGFSVEYDLEVTSQSAGAPVTARVNPISFGPGGACSVFVKVSTNYVDTSKAPGPALDFNDRVTNWGGGDVASPLKKANAKAHVRLGVDLRRRTLLVRIDDKEATNPTADLPDSCRGSVRFHAGIENSDPGNLTFTINIKNFVVQAVR